MDTFTALVLTMDPATKSLLDRKPDQKTMPPFSMDMYKQIMFIYQIIIILILGRDCGDAARVAYYYE